MAYPAGAAIIVESTRVITATVTLLIIPGTIPSELRKNCNVSEENSMAGRIPLGYARTFSWVVNAIEPMNQIGTNIHKTMIKATR